MKLSLKSWLFIVVVAGGIPLSAAEPPEWPQFLGPQRNGVSAETGLIDKLPADGPRLVWREKGGVGMAGIAVSGGKAVTMVQRESKQRLVAFDAKTGTPAWETEIAPEYENQMGNGPRGTPAIADGRVFVFTGEGILAAANLTDGKRLWSRQVLQDVKSKPADYGIACSPLVVGQQVLVIAGGREATVAAYDVATGEPAWTAGSDPAGYSSPALLNVGGKEQIVVFAGNAVLGLAPTKGTVLWRYPYETDFNCNIATPLAYKGQVFVSSGENHGSVLLALKGSGDKLEAAKVWESQGPKSVLRSEWQTPILLGDHLYGFDNVGGAGPVSHLTCINAATGERVWQKARFGKGNLIAADGKLFILTIAGELVVAKASPDAYDELARAKVVGMTRQAPALANGLMYLRDDQEVVCLDVRQP